VIGCETVFVYTGHSASHRQNQQKNLERGENLLQNGILHFVLWISQLSEIELQS